MRAAACAGCCSCARSSRSACSFTSRRVSASSAALLAALAARFASFASRLAAFAAALRAAFREALAIDVYAKLEREEAVERSLRGRPSVVERALGRRLFGPASYDGPLELGAADQRGRPAGVLRP